MRRRTLIHRLAMAAAAMVLLPVRALANWNQIAFQSPVQNDALMAAFGRSDTVTAVEIELKMPTTAHLGAMVPIMVSTHLPDVTRMALLVHENPQPLTALVEFGPSALPEMATRVRLFKSSEVSVVVESNGLLFTSSQPVQVVVSSCDSGLVKESEL